QVSENESEKQMEKIPKKVYLKALPLKSIEDLNSIKDEVRSGNILILRVSPLAKKSIDDVQRAVSELCEFTESIGGDIARLGQERIVITPSSVNIWREKAKTSEAESTAAL
ncbi:MAG: cell division protein SepF, partial [Candidatus Bathyarchaeia archaeon]